MLEVNSKCLIGLVLLQAAACGSSRTTDGSTAQGEVLAEQGGINPRTPSAQAAGRAGSSPAAAGRGGADASGGAGKRAAVSGSAGGSGGAEAGGGGRAGSGAAGAGAGGARAAVAGGQGGGGEGGAGTAGGAGAGGTSAAGAGGMSAAGAGGISAAGAGGMNAAGAGGMNAAGSGGGGGTSGESGVPQPPDLDSASKLSGSELRLGEVLGYYSGAWGELALALYGPEVRGSYSRNAGTLVVAPRADGVLAGVWSEAPARTAPESAGEIELRFIRNGDVVSVAGRYRNGAQGSWREDLGLLLVSGQDAPDELEARLDDAAAFKRAL